VPRVIGVVDSARNFSQGPSTAAFDGTNVRTATTDGNNNFWGTGGAAGSYYAGNTAPAGFLQTTHTVNRVMNIFNGNLYFSYSSSSQQGPGIYAYSGTPTSASTPIQFIPTGTGSSPYDFALNSGGTVAYIADDRTAASGGGIQRWDFNGTSWSLSYTLGVGNSVGARGLAVDFLGGNTIIYATTSEGSGNRLVSILDAGAGSPFATLATAPGNEIFRGLDFVTVPEPSTYALLGAGAVGLLLARRRK
jgi:hypothetical protein